MEHLSSTLLLVAAALLTVSGLLMGIALEGRLLPVLLYTGALGCVSGGLLFRRQDAKRSGSKG